MDASEYLWIRVFLKTPYTGPLKSRASGSSIGNTVYATSYLVNTFDFWRNNFFCFVRNDLHLPIQS